MQVNARELPELLEDTLRAGLVGMVHGSPAVGKSKIVEKLAIKFNLKMVDIRLSQADPTELNGFPHFENNRASYIPMDTFPIEGDQLPLKADGTSYDGWLLFFDELTSSPLSVQAASYKIILDRLVGQYKLHPNVAMVAAGNLLTDKAIVNRMSTAMQSRLIHFELVMEHKAWMTWAAQNDIDYRIVSFIGFKPEILYTFDPDHNGYTYASPRTWEFCSKLIKKYPDEIPAKAIPLMAGAVDEYAAREFWTYAQIFPSLITVPQIVKNPTGIEVPQEPSVLFALSGSIGQKIDSNNAEALMKFIDRLDIEFQILTLQQGLTSCPDIRRLPAVREWRRRHAEELF